MQRIEKVLVRVDQDPNVQLQGFFSNNWEVFGVTRWPAISNPGLTIGYHFWLRKEEH
jgi:hypothetical protein